MPKDRLNTNGSSTVVVHLDFREDAEDMLRWAWVCHLAEVGQADVHTGSEASAQVGGAGQDVAKALVPHELPASLLNQPLNLPHSRDQIYNATYFTCNTASHSGQ